jgi:hypothetical protein
MKALGLIAFMFVALAFTSISSEVAPEAKAKPMSKTEMQMQKINTAELQLMLESTLAKTR